MTLRFIDAAALPEVLASIRPPFHADYYAMYSGWLNGIVTDPALMLIPADDHMVHRGDGLFEAFKCVRGAIYNLKAHVDRLASSAKALDLALPCSEESLQALIVETARAGRHPDCMIRVYLSRGPGSFAANPLDCPAPQLYIVVTRLLASFMERHPGGAKLCVSRIPVKPAFLATLKCCNYLPNALMEKEAADRGVHFSAAFDEHGRLAEGATENLGIVTREGELRFPRLERIIPGTTMLRVAELAGSLVEQGRLKATRFDSIAREALAGAAEALICGTSPDVTAVVEIDGRPVGSGRPGPIALALRALLLKDIHDNPAMRTPVF
ncbi:MAG: aminotransferase class IV [Lentisphaerae bacterium]|nr:aminotransferase class IV [Lentisphaerota bacterium]